MEQSAISTTLKNAGTTSTLPDISQVNIETLYDFPAEHWKHIRTTNPIESTFATVRHRTGKTNGCLSRKTGLAMAFKLMMSAQGKWQKLNAANRMPEIIQGIAFVDGSRQKQNAA